MVITAFPRVHVGLIDLGHATARAYGGMGIAVSGPTLRVTARPESSMVASGFDVIDERARADVQDLLNRWQVRHPNATASVELLSAPRQHVGLGTKTALMLSIATALDLVAETHLPRQQLQLLTGRGGTSGVGIHAFFSGGVVADAGHDPRAVKTYGPSGGRFNTSIPPVMVRLPFPEDWLFTLVLPAGSRFAGAAEAGFFRRSTPVPTSEVLQTLSLMYHGVLPAIALRNFSMFREAVAGIQVTGFKRREVEERGPGVTELMAAIRSTGAAAGMSSLGPLVFAVTEAHMATERTQIEAVCSGRGDTVLGLYPPRNSGYEVSSD